MSAITPVNPPGWHEDPLDAVGLETPVCADDLIEAMDDHTRNLLRRPSSARRGRLVSRMLILADLLGLTLAYLIATLLWGRHGGIRLAPRVAAVRCIASLLGGRGQAPRPLPARRRAR